MDRSRAQFARERMLASVPHLNPHVRWERMDSGGIMAVYRRDLRGVRRLLAKLLATDETAQVLLDDAGSFVVDAVDGHRTVRELIALVAAEFKLSRKEAEMALLQYMETLGRRRLVGFELPGGEA